MTFYWWSHWFWITVLSTAILFISLVHTYPSQEISADHNQDVKASNKPITKLYQTTSSMTWVTSAPTSLKTIIEAVTPPLQKAKDLDNVEMDEYYDEHHNKHNESQENFNDDEAELVDNGEHEDEIEDFEFKRSVEVYNKTIEAEEFKKLLKSTQEKSSNSKEKLTENSSNDLKKKKELNLKNYTNFTNTAVEESTPEPVISNKSPPLGNAEKSKPASAADTPVNAAPKLHGTQTAPEWFNDMAKKSSEKDTVISASSIKEGDTESIDEEGHKIPITLENVNREDELRRAETEHRTRKSKVLSAEYKHLYINFSDSKRPLTRSASTAPNEFDNDIAGDEGNISSEALAIQRTYFLDAGAISAICFTVFGICCTVGTLGIVLYRRRYLNKPQTLSEPDSSVYIDDSTMRVSDNSDEMYSLDNDSFLNSLEAMTIQNYWTDTVKHTKL